MSDIQAEVVIIGAGIAGALLAARLSANGARVAILDAGPRVERAMAVQRFREALIKVPESPYIEGGGEAALHPLAHNPDHWYQQSGPDKFKSTYLKVVGGTTWHWLGTCLRFLPNDFALASHYGRGVDWPLDYAQLEPFYTEAEAELGVAGDATDDFGAPRTGDFTLPPIAQSSLDKVMTEALAGSDYRVTPVPQARNSRPHDGRPACCGSASCIPICPVQAKYDATVHLAQAEKNGAALYADSTAAVLETDADGRITAVQFRRPDGSGGRATGRVFVLAAHAIETPRLLLNSRSARMPTGVANRSDQVGRNLMDHPVQLSWALSGEPVWPYRGPVSTSGIQNLRDGAFRRQRSGMCVQISNDGWNWPTGGAITMARTLAEQGLRGKALHDAMRQQGARHIQLATMTEQLPHADNRITLDSKHHDRYGIPFPRLHYKVEDYVLDGLTAARAVHDDIFQRMNATEIQHKSEYQGAGHIIGTCRMGTDAASSVVDSDCRSHDHPNLFMLGSSVFPTAAIANPTLTIAALSLRAVTAVERDLRVA